MDADGSPTHRLEHRSNAGAPGIISILWAPRTFFERTAEATPKRLLPAVLASVVFGMLGTAPLISERRLSLAPDAGVAIIASFLLLLLGPICLAVIFWLPIRVIAGRAARAWETAGLSLMPAILAGFLVLLLAFLFPVNAVTDTWDLEQEALMRVEETSLQQSSYFLISGLVQAVCGFWSLLTLYRGLEVRAPERAGWAVGGVLLTNVLLTMVAPPLITIAMSVLRS